MKYASRNDQNNAAAARIQHAWRRYITQMNSSSEGAVKFQDGIKSKQCDSQDDDDDDTRIGNNTKKIMVLLKSNDEILRKLEAIRNSKAYEQMKYEKIARMNAHDVNTFLKGEFSKQQQIQNQHGENAMQLTTTKQQNDDNEYESIIKKRQQVKVNEAARIIQRFFRSMAVKKRREKLRKAWTEVDPQKRVQLISDIADRIVINRDTPQRVDLHTIKNKLKEKKEGLDKAIAEYERCERMIEKIQQDLQLLTSITSIEQLIKLDPRKLRCSKTALWLAERERERQLDRMEEDNILEEFATSPPSQDNLISE